MGVKRKAEALEEPQLLSPANRNTPSPSPVSRSPLSSAPSSENSNTNASPYKFYFIPAVPYLNSRTRKRHRDNRPNEEHVYESTLRKLYAAQKLHYDEAEQIPLMVDDEEDRLEDDQSDKDEMMLDDPAISIEEEGAKKGQTKLDTFFLRKVASRQQKTLDLLPKSFMQASRAVSHDVQQSAMFSDSNGHLRSITQTLWNGYAQEPTHTALD